MSAEAREDLAFRVRDERKKRHWNQRALAEAAGVSVGTVSNFERGLSFPQPHHLRSLLRVLDLGDDVDGDDPLPEDTSAAQWFAELSDDIRTALYMIGLYLERFGTQERDLRIREIVASIIDRRL